VLFPDLKKFSTGKDVIRVSLVAMKPDHGSQSIIVTILSDHY
jgi:hypothetical protein